MNIALLGYGKMGKEIEKIALERGHTCSLIIDVNNQADFNSENLKNIDVAIDFSIPTSAIDNIYKCFENNIPVVSGTTGWHDKLQEVSEECKKQNQTFFYASNYSVGVNIMFYMNKKLAEVMNSYPAYEVEIEETHHTQKLDAPSGTAITIAEDLLKRVDRKTKWELDKQSAVENLKITAIRRENVPGIHYVTYNSDIDTITLGHSAKNRKGFALGAVLAAEFIHDKKGAFTMQDLLGF